MIEWVASSAVAGGSLGLAFWGIRTMVSRVEVSRKEDKAEILGKLVENRGIVMDEINDTNARLSQDENDYLTEEKHDLICENKQLRVRQHVTAEISGLRTEMNEGFDDIKDLIKKNGNNGG